MTDVLKESSYYKFPKVFSQPHGYFPQVKVSFPQVTLIFQQEKTK